MSKNVSKTLNMTHHILSDILTRHYLWLHARNRDEYGMNMGGTWKR